MLLDGPGGVGVTPLRRRGRAAGSAASTSPSPSSAAGRTGPGRTSRTARSSGRSARSSATSTTTELVAARSARPSRTSSGSSPRSRPGSATPAPCPPGRRSPRPERRQGRVLEAMLGVVGRLCRAAARSLLVLEDLHDADAGTRALVTFLSRVRRHHRVCFVGTYAAGRADARPSAQRDPRARRPPADSRGRSGSRIAPFERSELADLVEAIEGERPTGAALVLVADRSRGLPLVAEELLAARREVSDASLTSSFDDLVIARLARRGPECRRVLRLLALCRPAGRPRRAGRRRRRLRADRGPPAAALVDAGPRRGDGGPRSRPRGRASTRRSSRASSSRRTTASPSATSTSGGPPRRTSCRGSARRHHLALAAGLVAHPGESARHWVAAHVHGSGVRRRRRRGRAGPRRPTPRRTPSSPSSWRSLLSEPAAPAIGRSGAGAGRSAARQSSGDDVIDRAPAPGGRGGVRGGSAGPGRRLRRGARRTRSTSAATASRSGVLYERLGRYRRAARRSGRRARRLRAGGGPRPGGAERRAGRRSSRRSPRSG